MLLTAAGLLKGKAATSHWGYADLFRRSFPDVRFIPEPNIVFADDSGRIVTAGGATAWHDLAIHIISRHCSPGEALHIAKVYLLQWHGDGQLPFASLVRCQATPTRSCARPRTSCARIIASRTRLPGRNAAFPNAP